MGKSKGGLTKGGLSPKFSEKIGGKSFLRNRAFSGQIGTFSGPIGAFSGPIGTNSSAPHSHGGRAEIAPKGPFWAQLAPFGPSPPLLSPPLDFPDLSQTDKDNIHHGAIPWTTFGEVRQGFPRNFQMLSPDFSEVPSIKNLLMPLFLMGCFPVDFQEVKRPLRTKSVKRPIKVGKRPINEGKRPIKAKVLVGVSVGCLMGCFRAPPPWRKTAPLKRPIKRSMSLCSNLQTQLILGQLLGSWLQSLYKSL